MLCDGGCIVFGLSVCISVHLSAKYNLAFNFFYLCKVQCLYLICKLPWPITFRCHLQWSPMTLTMWPRWPWPRACHFTNTLCSMATHTGWQCLLYKLIFGLFLIILYYMQCLLNIDIATITQQFTINPTC